MRPFLKYQVAELVGHGRVGSEDASDIVQQALLQAIEQIDLFQGDTVAQWRSWLHTIAKNKVLDSHRYWSSQKRNSQRVIGDHEAVEQLAASDRSPSSIVKRQESSHKLALAMNQLSADDRRLIEFRQVEGLDHAEIGQRLGISEAASRQRLRSAMSRLRRAWKSLGQDSTLAPKVDQ